MCVLGNPTTTDLHWNLKLGPGNDHSNVLTRATAHQHNSASSRWTGLNKSIVVIKVPFQNDCPRGNTHEPSLQPQQHSTSILNFNHTFYVYAKRTNCQTCLKLTPHIGRGRQKRCHFGIVSWGNKMKFRNIFLHVMVFDRGQISPCVPREQNSTQIVTISNFFLRVIPTTPFPGIYLDTCSTQTICGGRLFVIRLA